MDVVKVSWSGGKDSTCAVLLHLERGDKVKAVCYVPMFTAEIPLLLKEHYEFILQTADRFRLLGADVWIVHGMHYYDFVMRRSTRGKFKGRAFGFPCFLTGRCNFKKESKLKALVQVDVGDYDYEDIGIAADEVARHGQLSEKKRSILVELGVTEYAAMELCRGRGVLSPLYEVAKRDGCILCPHAKVAVRERWFQDYPEAVPLVVELQEFVKRERPGQYPLRNQKWFIDTGD